MNFWEFLAGLGMFLFGMFLLEEAVEKLSGRAFKKFIRKYTEGRIRSVFTGAFATAVLQSSSAVTLMVLAFSAAGLVTLTNAIGVILGSNLGTTLTSWIVASIGFKVKIEALAMPFVGIGGLGLIFFGKSPRLVNICRLLVGFGFLFMGLEYMKTSIEELSQHINLADYAGWGSLFFVLIGFVLTAIVQSSSASMAIILTAVHSGVLPFILAAAMVIGTNLGTTLTVLLGSLGGVNIKKRVAYSHFFFNFFTGFLAIALLPLLTRLVTDVMHLKDDAVIGLAMFHTIFNLLGVLLFLPFLHTFTKFIERIAPEQKKQFTRYLHALPVSTAGVAEANIAALRNETRHFLLQTISFNSQYFNIQHHTATAANTGKNQSKNPSQHQYNELKNLQGAIFSYAAQVQNTELSGEEAVQINRLLHSVRHALASAKMLKDVSHNFSDMKEAGNEFLNTYFTGFIRQARELYPRLAELITAGEQNHALVLPELLALVKHIHSEDIQLIESLSQAINRKQLDDIHVPLILSANRGFVLAADHALMATKELLLTDQEATTFENLDMSLQAL